MAKRTWVPKCGNISKWELPNNRSLSRRKSYFFYVLSSTPLFRKKHHPSSSNTSKHLFCWKYAPLWRGQNAVQQHSAYPLNSVKIKGLFRLKICSLTPKLLPISVRQTLQFQVLFSSRTVVYSVIWDVTVFEKNSQKVLFFFQEELMNTLILSIAFLVKFKAFTKVEIWCGICTFLRILHNFEN